MPYKELVLYYGCALAGLIIIGGSIVLLYKQKVYIDSSTNQVTEIVTPIIRFKTNLPMLGLFAVGLVALVVPITQAAKSTTADLLRRLNEDEQELVKTQSDLTQKNAELARFAADRVVTGSVQVAGEAPVEVFAVVEDQSLHPPWEFRLRIPPAAQAPKLVVTSDGRVVEEKPIGEDENDVGVIANWQPGPGGGHKSEIIPDLQHVPPGF